MLSDPAAFPACFVKYLGSLCYLFVILGVEARQAAAVQWFVCEHVCYIPGVCKGSICEHAVFALRVGIQNWL